jgi:endonuclease YncB( thermonuclease family)
MRLQASFLLLFLVFNIAEAFSFTGEVVGVLDGDTLEVLHNGKAQRVRLHGIDCPEKGQPFGKVAKWATSALVFGRTVTLQPHATDRYKRVVADIVLMDATHVNQRLVKDGWCWWYRKYAPDDLVLEGFETEAREAKRGLWSDIHPVPPWAER